MKSNRPSTRTQLPIRALLLALIVAVVVVVFALRGLPAEADTTRAVADLSARPAAGYPAPDFTLTTIDGEPFQLSALYGQPVILNFWASWCGPCRLEMPHLQTASVTNSEDVAIIGVNLTERESRLGEIDAFIDEFGLTFPIVLDEHGDVADLYEVRGQPASVFIDKNGVVHTVFYGPVTDEFIQSRIDELAGS